MNQMTTRSQTAGRRAYPNDIAAATDYSAKAEIFAAAAMTATANAAVYTKLAKAYDTASAFALLAQTGGGCAAHDDAMKFFGAAAASNSLAAAYTSAATAHANAATAHTTHTAHTGADIETAYQRVVATVEIIRLRKITAEATAAAAETVRIRGVANAPASAAEAVRLHAIAIEARDTAHDALCQCPHNHIYQVHNANSIQQSSFATVAIDRAKAAYFRYIADAAAVAAITTAKMED